MLNRGDYWQCGFVIPKDREINFRSEGYRHFVMLSHSSRRSWPTVSANSATGSRSSY